MNKNKTFVNTNLGKLVLFFCLIHSVLKGWAHGWACKIINSLSILKFIQTAKLLDSKVYWLYFSFKIVDIISNVFHLSLMIHVHDKICLKFEYIKMKVSQMKKKIEFHSRKFKLRRWTQFWKMFISSIISISETHLC